MYVHVCLYMYVCHNMKMHNSAEGKQIEKRDLLDPFGLPLFLKYN